MINPLNIKNNRKYTVAVNSLPVVWSLSEAFSSIYNQFKHCEKQGIPMADVRLEVYSNQTGYMWTFNIVDIVNITEKFLGLTGVLRIQRLIYRKLKSEKFEIFLEKTLDTQSNML